MSLDSCLNIIAVGEGEGIPDLWKMLLTGAGMILLAGVVYKMMNARILALEIEMKALRDSKQIKDDQYTTAIADAQTYKALYDSLKVDYDSLKARTS